MRNYKVTFHFYQAPQSDEHLYFVEAASEPDAIKQAKIKLDQDFPREFSQPHTVRCDVEKY